IGQVKPDDALEMRHGLMKMISMNVGNVAGMARGTVDYDAAAAQQAADNLAALGMLDVDALWPEGTATGEIGDSRALPAVWSDRTGFLAQWEAFGTATQAMQATAGDGLDALKVGLGEVGKTCGACHDDYRQSSS
ncbi:MAG: cytochrome c, partial [Jannaschia sp.]